METIVLELSLVGHIFFVKRNILKNKKLVIILAIFIFITVLVVLNSTLFTLQKIEVDWLTTRNYFLYANIDDREIVSDVKTGDSIFLLNKSEISSVLEKKYPYLRVVGIETKFPNKIVVHSAERERLFAIKVASGGGRVDDEYVYIDDMGKVISTGLSKEFANSELGSNPIRISTNNFIINPKEYIVGENVKNEAILSILSNISMAMKETGHTPTTSKGVFKDITVDFTGDKINVSMATRNGMVIAIKDVDDGATNKLLLGLEVYNRNQQNGVVDGVISVFRADDQVIRAVYSYE